VNTITVVILAIVVVVLIALGVFIAIRWRRSQILRNQFGPEYKHAVKQYGDERKAEAELAAREKRIRKREIRPLTREERSSFVQTWRKTQARFVDEPSQAIGEADELVKEVMQTRGYPVGDFDQRAADISVDYPNLVTNYRSGREIAVRNKKGEATTEDLRQAMMHYRSLFEELVEAAESATSKEAIR
jgi:pyridoxal biosynthesis lyase PdxS